MMERLESDSVVEPAASMKPESVGPVFDNDDLATVEKLDEVWGNPFSIKLALCDLFL